MRNIENGILQSLYFTLLSIFWILLFDYLCVYMQMRNLILKRMKKYKKEKKINVYKFDFLFILQTSPIMQITNETEISRSQAAVTCFLFCFNFIFFLLVLIHCLMYIWLISNQNLWQYAYFKYLSIKIY